MVLTVPVLAWPGRDFLTGAFAAPRVRRLTMDVPVALGLSVAFLGSVRETITGEGEVWLDSVVMLVTLLCIARYLELLARRRATATVRALVRSVPLVATRIGGGAATRGPPDGVIRSGTADGLARENGNRPEAEECIPHTDGGGYAVEDVIAQTGGVAGRIGGIRHAIGSADFVARLHAPALRDTSGREDGMNDARACRGREDAVGGAGVAHRPSRTQASVASGGGSGEDDGHHASTTREEMPGSEDSAVRTRAPALPDAPDGETGAGDTHVFLARDDVLLACFTLADTLRGGAKALVEGLHTCGIGVTIAPGDRPEAVDRAARALGVERRFAGLSPEDKLREAGRLAAHGERVLMLGDGVNDTPALAGAYVSVAMGRGAAAAAARAGAVLIGDDPRRLLAGVDVARRARRIVKQNLAWAAGYNLVALPLAASGAVPPWAAAIGMSLSSLAVVGNALHLGRARGIG